MKNLAEKLVKKLLLVAAFSAAFAASAIAQTSYPVPPRDPPFGKGNLDSNTEREPNRNSSADESIPPRDPPFGKGELRDDTPHLPSSATAQGKTGDAPGNGDIPTSAKKDARTKSALKKDSAKNGTRQDSAPKSDAD
jgi:hypothetical protein